MDMDLDEVSHFYQLLFSAFQITRMISIYSVLIIFFAGGMYNDYPDIQKPCERLFGTQEQSGSSKQARSFP